MAQTFLKLFVSFEGYKYIRKFLSVSKFCLILNNFQYLLEIRKTI